VLQRRADGARRAEHRTGRDTHVLERDVTERPAQVELRQPPDRHASGVTRDQELPGPVRRARGHQEKVRHVGGLHGGLLAGQDVAVAIAVRLGGDLGRLPSVGCLGQRPGGDGGSLGYPRQVLGLLLRRPGAQQRVDHRRRRQERTGCDHAPDLFGHHDQVEHRVLARRAAVLLGHEHRGPAELRGLPPVVPVKRRVTLARAFPDARQRRGLLQEPSCRLLKEPLLLGKFYLHRSLTFLRRPGPDRARIPSGSTRG